MHVYGFVLCVVKVLELQCCLVQMEPVDQVVVVVFALFLGAMCFLEFEIVGLEVQFQLFLIVVPILRLLYFFFKNHVGEF